MSFSTALAMVGKRILVIDTEPVSVLIKLHLTLRGHKVMTASGHAEIYKKIKHFRPEVITMDTEGGVGIEMIERLKSDPSTRDIPVMVLTISDNEEQCLEMGANCFMQKPFDADKLAQNIDYLAS
jgi:CheY-like chemotaxis protein